MGMTFLRFVTLSISRRELLQHFQLRCRPYQIGYLNISRSKCLVCYDAGFPCAARQACDDPLALIFPFQEDEATRCGSCGSIFHKQCFRKISVCPCGKSASTGTKNRGTRT
eukprot:UN13992